MSDKYSAFDEKGLPTREIPTEKFPDGKEVSKEIRNKLQKEWNKQEKIYLEQLKKDEAASEKKD